MKTTLLTLFSFLFLLNANSQETKGIFGNENWLQNWTNFKPSNTDYKTPNVILSGKINQNTTLYKKNTYLLVGTVYVTNNAVLTIEPGTTIRGDFKSCGTLVIAKDSKIIANGVETDPIVFTSNKEISNRKSGDWGGIIILGNAPINKFGNTANLDFNLDLVLGSYGGLQEKSDSGILKYIRIEYSGRKLNATRELNGLSLAGVGNKTKLEFIQISYSNDDSFECYGGNVILNNLISYKATDDDFDFTQGTQCIINNSLAIRYPYFSDINKSRCFEIDSYDKIENMDFTKKFTKITATNITLVNNEENDQNLVREAIFIKDNSFFSFIDGVICGFNAAIVINEGTQNKKYENLELKNNYIADCKNNILNENNISIPEFEAIMKNNKTIKIKNIELFNQYNPKTNPDFRLKQNINFAFGL